MAIPNWLEPLRGPVKRLFRMAEWQKVAMQHSDQPVPVYPRRSDEPGIRVHLGAGEINLQGWVNVDARAFAHIHAQTTSLALPEFVDGSVRAIYICHVLEHLSFADAKSVIEALHRKLMPGGTLIVAVPDFDALVTVYLESGRNFETIKHPLMGGQGYEYNFHRSMYTRGSLEACLHECGFDSIQPWTTVEEFGGVLGDWSSESLPSRGRAIPLSLNLKALKRG